MAGIRLQYFLTVVILFLLSCSKTFPTQMALDDMDRNADTLVSPNEYFDYSALWAQGQYAVIEDGFSPPVAARIFAYSFLAQYETWNLVDFQHQSLLRNGWLDEDFDHGVVNKHLASSLSYLLVLDHLLYRPGNLRIAYSLVEAEFGEIDSNSLEFLMAQDIAQDIINFSSLDKYSVTRGMPVYQPTVSPISWYPTPPTYGAALEPYWGSIRPFYFDSVSVKEYVLDYPTYYLDSTGVGLNPDIVDTVENARNLQGEETLAIAEHWDCNPRQSLTYGHVMTKIKQNNPAGHWLGIAASVMDSLAITTDKKLYIMAVLATSLHDGFVICWKTKFLHDVIRPETWINTYRSPLWTPMIETPLFPEYTSGHSVVSSISDVLLTHFLGDSIQFTDSVNQFMNFPPRKYNSFHEAATEAAMSRFYSGIHFKGAVLDGLRQGKMIADGILSKLVIEHYPE